LVIELLIIQADTVRRSKGKKFNSNKIVCIIFQTFLKGPKIVFFENNVTDLDIFVWVFAMLPQIEF